MLLSFRRKVKHSQRRRRWIRVATSTWSDDLNHRVQVFVPRDGKKKSGVGRRSVKKSQNHPCVAVKHLGSERQVLAVGRWINPYGAAIGLRLITGSPETVTCSTLQ